MKNKMKRLLGILLSFALVLGLMPGMSLTVNAYAGNPYASLVNTTTSVKFNDMDWYIIADDSTAVDAGTVTLLSKDPIGTSKFHESQDSVYVYSISLVKDYLDSLTGTGGTFEAVADAIVTVKVKGSDRDSEVDAKLWLLSTSEAEGLSEDVRKCSTAMSYYWWLRSRGSSPNKAALVYSENGYVSGDNAWYELGVRPALKLDLSKVTFDSSTKKFELTPVVEYPLWVGGVQVTSANKDDVLGNTDEGATVSYDVDTNTLTLNGVDIAEGYKDPYYDSTSGIYYSGNDSLSIVLSEDSNNKVGVTGNVQIGIESSRNITISGAGKLTVKGSGNYSVGIEAYALTIKDAEINVEGAYNGIQTQKYGYGVNIISGKVNATGKTGTGIHSGMDVNWKTKSAVTVGENATVVAIGGNKAIDYLKNAIAGTGWTDPEDNTSKTTISINSEGQSIDTLKKMAFPELPASTVTTAPEANDLIFTGSAQELVTAGVTSDGEMQYALGTDATTAPTSDWGTSIPTKTDAGTYYVWYKVVGDANHFDSEAKCIKSIIKEQPKEEPKDEPKDEPKETQKEEPKEKPKETPKEVEVTPEVEENTEDNSSEEVPTETQSPYRTEWVDGQWYDSEGNATYKPQGKWYQDNTGWWYQDEDGWYPSSQWQKIDGKWYYFTSDGYMDYSEYRDGFWLGSDGAWVETYYGGGWGEKDGQFWYEDASGWYPVSQWLWINGKCYYFGSDGYRVYNQYVDGYWVNNDGEWEP